MNFTAGKYLTLSNKISRGVKDMPEYLDAVDYVQSIDAATRMGVVLSDMDTRQHWLADGASVILHLCRAWLAKPHAGYAPGDQSTELWSPQDAADPPSASRDTLTSMVNRGLKLYISHVKHLSKPNIDGTHVDVVTEQQWFLVQDLAHRHFKWLELIQDRANKSRHSPDIDLIKKGKRIIGFEFLDLLSGDGRIEPYVHDLGNGADVWLPYTRSRDTVHIFGSKFGELIQPNVPSGKLRVECSRQYVVPRDVDYLVAPLCVLKLGMERLRHTNMCAQLSHGMYWWNVDSVFEGCKCQCPVSYAQCTLLVKKLHGECLERSSPRAVACLPQVFKRFTTGAIIMGSEPQRLKKNPPTTSHVASKSLDQGAPQRSGTLTTTRELKRLPSDSGYASNAGKSSRDTQSSSLSSEANPPEDFRIRGAAREPEGKKLTKRRKIDC